MSSLANCEKKLLLEVARNGLALAVASGAFLEDLPDHQGPGKLSGAFVTLRRYGRLRGCIGQLPSGVPLIQVIAYCVNAAALQDPRFEAVRREEVPEIDIEISVLSPPQDIAPHQIEVGRHGLIVARGERRGLLLPQVGREFGWTADRFLEETCLKAGLDRGAWRDPATSIQAFTADVFSEATVQA